MITYRDVEIEAFGLEKTRGENKERFWTFKVRLSDSLAGSMSADEAVTVQFDHRQLRKKLSKLDSRALKGEELVAFGQELADVLMPDEKYNERSSLRSLFEDNRKAAAAGENEGVRLRLKLGYELAKLPWEFIYLPPAGGSGGVDGFLALDGRVSIVRHESMDSARHDPAPVGEIKMVAAFASAEGAAELDLDQEQANLEDAIKDTENLKAEILQDAEFSEVTESLLPKNVGIFHFAGHGDVHEEMGEEPGQIIAIATLGFDDNWIKAEQLAINLRDSGVRLAMLGACDSGRREGKNPWASIATMLVKTGVPAVVANQFKILDKTAIAFSKLFYKALVAGLSIEEAVSAGRKAAYNADPDGRDWGIQATYMRGKSSQILFEGTADETQKSDLKQEVLQTIVKNITNINSGGGTVITGDVNVSGDFIGGSRTSVNVGGNLDGGLVTGDHSIGGRNHVIGDNNRIIHKSDSVGENRDHSESNIPENEEINNAMAHLRVDLMGKVSADKKQMTGQRLSELEDELQKGSQAEDSDIAAMIKDLDEWVPAGKDAIKAAFAAPALKTIAEGTFTQFMLSQL